MKKDRDFGLQTMALTRKCLKLELSGVRRDYMSGCFDNAIAKCDSMIREAKRLKKIIQIEKRERNAKGRRVKVKLSTTITGDVCVRVPEGADAAKFVAWYLRRKDIRVARCGVYSNETAEIREGEDVKTIYPWR